MYVIAGQPFTANLIDPGGLTDVNLGARIEVPVTRAIVTYWQPAALLGTVWALTLDSPPVAAAHPGADPVMDAALAAREFELVWMDGLEPPTAEIFTPLFTYDAATPPFGSVTGWPPPDTDALAPSVDDIANLERTRTVDSGGDEQTTFTDDTRPSASDVQALIAEAVPIVLAQLQPTFPPDYYGQVSHAIALYTAILIEGSFFREQLNEGAVALWRSLYTTAITATSQQIETELAGATSGGRLV